LMLNKVIMDAITAGQDPRRVWMDWNEAIECFMPIRARYLLY
jgi:hypothetical protein